MAVTIRQVAKTAGVSVGTVSRVLNTPSSVKAKTLEKVRAVIEDLGFEPDPRAQNMRRSFTMTVGYIVNDITIPIHARVFRGAEGEFNAHGYSAYLINTGGRPQQEAEAIRKLQRGRVDGLVLILNSEESEQTVELLRGLTIPAVIFDRELPVAVDSVVSDHATGTRDAVEYLFELGHRRIGLITSGLDVFPGRARRQGYIEAFRSRGLPFSEDMIRNVGMSAEFGMREAMNMLAGPERPTAIVAGGSQILVGVLGAIHQMRLVVGRDISLIGTDRTDVSITYPGTLTIVDRDLDVVGQSIAHLLMQRIKGATEREPRRLSYPTYLTLGKTCGPAPVPAPRPRARRRKPAG